ncbi:5-formyltetrahydrofolate cyclo-ligase [Breoghania sp. L-A4]|uniref:5-formyltetrahydrofolate cyclo-ligase n=1 Tax=Breoghania sp. L-A4 TaxID=2304600 RepID=UPI000E35CC87|nr:5-formyltetrahydrofolate cyclo-ligase [Breoghania sp. L-A4]AXS39775.1 5-formyltetrahydrofolate cyclo-ligase [Breoghania sp. L-A4]
MHELEPEYAAAGGDADLKRWRKAERARQIAARLAIPADERRGHSERIGEALDHLLGTPDGLTVSLYWPFRGEPDLRDWAAGIAARGGRCALPVVIEPAAPLIFRRWTPGDPLDRGVWNIPIPTADAEQVMPDVVIAPLVGFDPRGFRLGYGGGFFDRTLAAMPRKPRVIGVGYTAQRIPTIYPQPYDIAMDVILTEDGVFGA